MCLPSITISRRYSRSKSVISFTISDKPGAGRAAGRVNHRRRSESCQFVRQHQRVGEKAEEKKSFSTKKEQAPSLKLSNNYLVRTTAARQK